MTGRFSKSPKAALLLFGAIFTVLGIVAFVYGYVLPKKLFSESQSWVAVPAVIESSGLHMVSGVHPLYSIAVRYRYTYNGQTYHSDLYDLENPETRGYTAKESVVNDLPKGKTVSCYVDPHDPSRAVLHRSPPGIFALLSSLLFIAVGVMLTVWGISWKSARRASSESHAAASDDSAPHVHSSNQLKN